jgi:hypothetical protein
LKSTASDPETLEDTYEEWVRNATKAIKRMKKRGVELFKVDFDVIQFNQWCRANRKTPDGESRSVYVADCLRLQDKYN